MAENLQLNKLKMKKKNTLTLWLAGFLVNISKVVYHDIVKKHILRQYILLSISVFMYYNKYR